MIYITVKITIIQVLSAMKVQKEIHETMHHTVRSKDDCQKLLTKKVKG